MDHADIEQLQDHHPAWGLLRAANAPLILAFLGRYFVEEHHGATSAPVLAEALDDDLYALNRGDADAPRYPRSATDYLDNWSQTEHGWLRRFYPVGSDEVHYDATPAFEKAYSWVSGLGIRTFVGTESRLHTAIELLRQIVHGSETDPEARLVELHRRRRAVDDEIAAVERGELAMLDGTAVRDRYQQFATTARDLLSDFREVEENFRVLDRAARERIATWEGSKGNLLAQLVGRRSDITDSDQGRSFGAFYDFLLSETRQDEMTDLLARAQSLVEVEADNRLRTVHHDWSEAAERTQHTVRQISEQLRRFLDDQIWLENRRVVELVRSIESSALRLRGALPDVGLEVDEPGISIALPFERPLFDNRPSARVRSLLEPDTGDEVDASALFAQAFVDQMRLATQVRAEVPERGSALLSDIIGAHPVEQGAAEIVGYLALAEDDIAMTVADDDEMVIDYVHNDGPRRVRLPKVTVTRR